MTNPALDKLLAEAKAYLETSLWIKADPRQPHGTLQPSPIRLSAFAVTGNPASPNNLEQSIRNPKHKRRRIPRKTRKIPRIHQKHRVNRQKVA